MNCPNCGQRLRNYGKHVRKLPDYDVRRHLCGRCEFRWLTWERPMPAFPSKSKPKKPMRVRKNDALPEVPVPDLRPEDVPPPPEREWREEFERKIRGDQT